MALYDRKQFAALCGFDFDDAGRAKISTWATRGKIIVENKLIDSENAINREVNAVNSEHRKNYNSDSWRLFQFLLNLANKNSALNTFPTGSSKTLDKKNIREELIKFYNKYYISSNISICIASALSLKDQEKIIYNTFGLIDSNKEDNYNNKLNKPFYSNNLLKTYHLK